MFPVPEPRSGQDDLKPSRSSRAGRPFCRARRGRTIGSHNTAHTVLRSPVLDEAAEHWRGARSDARHTPNVIRWAACTAWPRLRQPCAPLVRRRRDIQPASTAQAWDREAAAGCNESGRTGAGVRSAALVSRSRGLARGRLGGNGGFDIPSLPQKHVSIP